MRNYEEELANRVRFIQEVVTNAGAKGIVYGNSGGKDSALVGILCKKACENTIAVRMPCEARRSYEEDLQDAQTIATQYGIELRTVSLDACKEALIQETKKETTLTSMALQNVTPRLRMATLYLIAASEGCLVAGCGNRSEHYVGYFTKWGDGAYDLNPIADLTVSEIYAFLQYLQAPQAIVKKQPSAALYDGQSDEEELGICYASLDRYLDGQEEDSGIIDTIQQLHLTSQHKRNPPLVYGDTK